MREHREGRNSRPDFPSNSGTCISPLRVPSLCLFGNECATIETSDSVFRRMFKHSGTPEHSSVSSSGVLQQIDVRTINMTNCPRHGHFARPAARKIPIKCGASNFGTLLPRRRLSKFREHEASISRKSAATRVLRYKNGLATCVANGFELRCKIHLRNRTNRMQCDAFHFVIYLESRK